METVTAPGASKVSVKITQEWIVFALAVVIFALFSLILRGFATVDNMLALVRNVSILGILSVGMALSILGRGIDLSIVATMAVSVAWMILMLGEGVAPPTAFALALAFVVLVGAANGFLVAYVEIPAVFTTLAMGGLVYGLGRFAMISVDIVNLPPGQDWLRGFGSGTLAGIPAPVIVFAVVCVVAYLFLSYAKAGRFVYALGDNPAAARISGVPVRPLIVLQYVIAALIAFCAGLVMTANVDSMNTRIVNSTLVYDVILVVVLGGIGLGGGKGGIRNVVVGTLLIGILLNGMTIMNIPFLMQNIIKGIILLAAIVADTLLNPRDEQTSQQGDI
ncbi:MULTISPECIES: ABC transporter permease [unclassified Mesorhizobium]|uniref:ABC transporter permease n=1 Tax=unclassified Mesorhizobium TaxID=325217 RepID=UPI000959F338|nr:MULTISPECIES: ABC transporter permease [unclassified Mesorhizobium]MBN9259011.1 ABC transporter permease [Mesorhizobium sp.]OJX75140.1 MAG: ABC transporter permease [Mesorhizobium sp. 65-26]